MQQKAPKPSRKERIIVRNQKLRKRYHALGTAPTWYRHEKIMEILVTENPALTEETIWLIISKTGYYKEL